MVLVPSNYYFALKKNNYPVSNANDFNIWFAYQHQIWMFFSFEAPEVCILSQTLYLWLVSNSGKPWSKIHCWQQKEPIELSTADSSLGIFCLFVCFYSSICISPASLDNCKHKEREAEGLCRQVNIQSWHILLLLFSFAVDTHEIPLLVGIHGKASGQQFCLQ